ncbi:hypothetical protein F4820DRAFT_449444 [Hypoxylon rubiginosum]|uniref:Uncharacterized protein n=1 Tax=Hypoxylon rubiginosum TaxID=110542 RepID=A0ACB9YYB9_9PEZI|nr:hypothetical protein F4820DRAFT_449444 [Hypoxylon rubiginosum]
MSGRRKKPEDVIWVQGMKLGRGAPHEFRFQGRIFRGKRHIGTGTMDDPKVTWVDPGPQQKKDVVESMETLVHSEAKKYGLSYAWIASEGHPYSTTAFVKNTRIMSLDDFHLTLRLGISEDVCNLHGHIYMICEDNNIENKVVRAMTHDERGVIGGKNPQLWIWGSYPSESRDWPRSGIKYPKSPYEIKPGSILEYQMDQGTKEEEEARAASRL